MLLFAHGIQGRADLPVPLVAFYWAAAVVLVVSFVALWLGWRRPVFAAVDARDRAASGIRSRGLDSLAAVLGAISVLGLLLVFVAGLAGSTDLNDNIAPIAVFVVWWIGIASAAALGIDVWRIAHPVAWLMRLVRTPAERRPMGAIGVQFALIGLAAFAWLELVYPTAAHVRLLGWLILGWTLLTAVGMRRYGVERWLDHGEPFAVYTRVLHRLSWITLDREVDGRHRLRLRRPVAALASLDTPPGMVPFVGLLIGSVSFDGLSRTLWWKRRLADATIRLVDRGIDPTHAQQLVNSSGLLVLCCVAIGAFFAAARAARAFGALPARTSWGSTAQAFAPSLVPIAFAYVVAHYCSYFWFQGQRLIPLASDPLGRGWDLFGTGDYAIDYSTLSANAIWAVQLGAIVVGHVLGLVLAHDRALEIERDAPGSHGVRSQWPMLALMVLYTVGGLYFLSEGLNV